MAILEFKGSTREMSGAASLTADRGTTIDESLRYLNDNGHYGIYEPVAMAIEKGRACGWDPETGKQIGLTDQVKEKAVITPRFAGGNGGGGSVWTLINSTNYGANSYFLLAQEAIPQTAGNYTYYPTDPSNLRYRWARYDFGVPAWVTIATWDAGVGGYPGYISMGREGFTPQTCGIYTLYVYESLSGQPWSTLVPNIPDYGTSPSDTPSGEVIGHTYRGTGRVSKTVLV